MTTADYPLPRLIQGEPTESFTPKLKRTRLSSPTLSSDPIFSSEDDEPSSENYIQQRNKKKFRGPWFCYHPKSNYDFDATDQEPQKITRSLKRDFDSGIFMGSDSSDENDFPESVHPKHSFISPFLSLASFHLSSSDDRVHQKIQSCLEEGNETIDLSFQGLMILTNEAIKPLSSFTRVPAVTEGVFSTLEPALKVFLSANQLKTLPCELFNISYLEVLSLRCNLIYELNSNIGNLLNLRELNLSQNELRYLPFEILTLLSEKGSLEYLSLHPNRFYEPQFPDGEDKCRFNVESSTMPHSNLNLTSSLGDSEDKEIRLRNNWWEYSFKASTEVRFFDINGSLVKGPKFSTSGTQLFPEQLSIAKDNYHPIPPLPRGNRVSRVHSLLEVALASCAKAPVILNHALKLLENSPKHIHDLLAHAAISKDRGNSHCTICGRKFIITRTEWIEWWDISKTQKLSSTRPSNFTHNTRDNSERLVPLIRRGCSWLCVPKPFQFEK